MNQLSIAMADVDPRYDLRLSLGLVLNGTSPVGVASLYRQNLDQATLGRIEAGDLTITAGGVLLLALTLGLEESSLLLATILPENSWNAMSPQRRAHLWGWEDEPDDVEAKDLLRQTQFADKKDMMVDWLTTTEFKERIWSATRIRKVFERAERVRNLCAHPRDDDSLEKRYPKPDALLKFIQEVTRLTDKIQRCIEALDFDSRPPTRLRIVRRPTLE